MPEKPLPITRSKPLIVQFTITVLLGLYNAIDAVSNAEFILQKLGFSEDAAKFLGSSRGIQALFWISLVGLLVSIAYYLKRYDNFNNPIEEINDSTFKKIVGESERIIVDTTLDYLLGFFKEHTNAQAQKLIETYLGKWIKLTSEVKNVDELPDEVMVFAGISIPPKIQHIFFHFNDQVNIDRAKLLRRDEEITILGEIVVVEAHSIHLKNCEFVSNELD